LVGAQIFQGQGEKAQLNPHLVAVVEDDLSILGSLESLLESAGYEVLPYSSAEDLLRSGRLQDINCLISDIGLPGMDGIELTRQIHLIRIDLPVVVITARTEPRVFNAALSAGARHVFSKPINSAQLLNSVAAAV
jgi:FixJ family two-component response regulator